MSAFPAPPPNVTGLSQNGLAQTILPQTGLPHRLALIIDGVCRVVAGRGGRDRALTPMMNLLWARLRRMAVRFDRLATMVRSASLPAAPVSEATEPVSAATRHPTARAQRPRPAVRLPRGFAWLIRLAPEAGGYRGQLEYMLADPEMGALLAAEPKLGRILRPLCRMLAIRPGPDLPAALFRRAEPPPHKPAPRQPRSGGRPADPPAGAVSAAVRAAAGVAVELFDCLPAPA